MYAICGFSRLRVNLGRRERSLRDCQPEGGKGLVVVDVGRRDGGHHGRLRVAALSPLL